MITGPAVTDTIALGDALKVDPKTMKVLGREPQRQIEKMAKTLSAELPDADGPEEKRFTASLKFA